MPQLNECRPETQKNPDKERGRLLIQYAVGEWLTCARGGVPGANVAQNTTRQVQSSPRPHTSTHARTEALAKSLGTAEFSERETDFHPY